MYKSDKQKCEEQNFWISYADLMAGLLFVFILLVGAIVIKYVYIQEDLQVIRTNLEKEKNALKLSDKALEDKKKRLKEIRDKLSIAQKERLRLAFELDKAKELHASSKKALEKSKKEIEKLTKDLTLYKTKEIFYNVDLKEKNKEISSLMLALEQNKKKNIELSEEATKFQTDIDLKSQQIDLNNEEIEKLKNLLFDYELKQKELNTTLSSTKNELDDSINIIKLKDEELAKLEEKLFIKSKAHQKLVDDLNITKVKIKNLTGIRMNVISKLKENLGKSIDIDEKSGALVFSSNILFEQDEYKLKEKSKAELSVVLKKYIHALLLNEELRDYIDTITIEGHTNSKGSYLYNLELSQKRALEVMTFLYSLDLKNKELFKKYLTASGRSFSDLIYKNGIEDKDASRRIEIKFRIKNEKAVTELENFLNRKDDE